MNDSASVAERLHDKAGRDIQPFMAEALQEIVSDLLMYGQYPYRGRVLMYLADFLADDYYGDDHRAMINDLQQAVLGESFDNTIRERWESALERYLEKSVIVEDRAAELEQQSREDA